MERALSGLKVLDLTMNLPGPYMTWLLAVLGAEVVKVENPVGGDYARALGTADGRPNPAFVSVNRNKKSLALNLKDPEGREIFLRLLDHYDVIIEGFRPGVMDSLGLGFQTLSTRQPRLIMVSISGYGQDGPNRLRAGHDINYLSLAGITSITGIKDGQLAVPGVQIADVAGGSLMAITGLLAALVQRQRTGQGQFVDVAMYEGVFSLATLVFGMVSSGLDTPGPGRMFLNGRLPCYGLYPTKDGRYMSLGALEFKFWRNFCRALEREDLIPKQFGPDEAREEVAGIFRGRTQAEWVAFFTEVDACCEAVLTLPEAADSDLCRAKGLVNTWPDGGRFLAPPLRLSASPSAPDEPAPELGEHTREILKDLGLDQEQLERLAARRVIL